MSQLDRRQFVGRALGTLGGVGLGALGGVSLERSGVAEAQPDQETIERQANYDALHSVVPFDGLHQAGIVNEAPAQATFAALDAIAPSRLTLQEALQALSLRARELCHGGAYPTRTTDEAAFDSGVLGPVNDPDNLTVTIAFGSSLFDGRYGLAKGLPHGLKPMRPFSIDDLDESQCGGDVLLQICSGQRDTAAHTLRELLRSVNGNLQLRWTMDGFKGAKRGPTPRSTPRNLFAFRDGTANPDPSDEALMKRLVWVPESSGATNGGARNAATAWTAGGSFQVVRLIAMHIEFWDRVGLAEQQRMIGRYRDSGAPLGGTSEFEDPDLASDPHGKRIPLNAHMRLANPRTETSFDQRILRRPYNYQRGFSSAGQLDQGLIFVAFNQDIARQFETVQKRLLEEPMIDYITPFGGGYYFAPPGSRHSGDWVGSGLFAATA
ncbi:MAG TPA: Dyp-type peroxidase [Solirubrobacteraceae bacterium]|jgi:deferrochelatase/peroxidase EfeB